MYNNKIFFSYTLSDGEVNREILSKVKNRFYEYIEAETYFDILDNDSDNHQKYVYKVLNDSKILCLIESSNIYKSTWVKKELYVAQAKKLPIVKMDKRDIESILDSNSKEKFLENSKIREIVDILYFESLSSKSIQ